jgi:hypothetical protein
MIIVGIITNIQIVVQMQIRIGQTNLKPHIIPLLARIVNIAAKNLNTIPKVFLAGIGMAKNIFLLGDRNYRLITKLILMEKTIRMVHL